MSDLGESAPRRRDGRTPRRVVLLAIGAATAVAMLGGSVGAVIVRPRPDVTVDKTAGNATISAGDTASFTITVTNIGTGAANSVTLDDALPGSGLAWTENPDLAACTITGNALHCDIGTLAAGGSFSVTVEAVTGEGDCGTLDNTATVAAANENRRKLGNNSDSASITVVCPPPPGGTEGCTPGYWKTHEERWDGVGDDDFTTSIHSTDLFNATFGVTSVESGLGDDVTLIQATDTGGGGVIALDRHAAAALASADSGIDYEFSVAQVIALYRDAVGVDPGPEDVDSAHTKLEAANERSCPLN